MSLTIYAGSMPLICLLIFGPDNFLIPAMISIPTGLFLLKSVIEKGGQSK